MDTDGGNKPEMTATNICKFLGLVKASGQSDTQRKDSHRRSDLTYQFYPAADSCGNNVTQNGVTFCKGGDGTNTFDDPTWGSMKCDCPPTKAPTEAPTKSPTKSPTQSPTKAPTKSPTTPSPTASPTFSCGKSAPAANTSWQAQQNTSLWQEKYDYWKDQYWCNLITLQDGESCTDFAGLTCGTLQANCATWKKCKARTNGNGCMQDLTVECGYCDWLDRSCVR